MSIISTQHKIKNRSTANDVFITPRPLAREHIEIVSKLFNWTCGGEERVHLSVLDPCRNNKNGSYYGQLGDFGWTFKMACNVDVDWCEISEGIDFFKYGNVENNISGVRAGVIIGNLPFSMIDKWLDHSAKLQPLIISYLMPVYSLTAKRLEMMEKAGYYLVNMHQFKWYVCNGMCCFATWLYKGKIPNREPAPDTYYEPLIAWNGSQPDCIKPFTFNRKVWYNVEKWEEKKTREKVREQKKIEKEKKIWKKKYNKIIKKDLIPAAFIFWDK